MAIESLADKCELRLGEYNNDDEGWVQFVKDHRTVLLNNSTVTTISLDMANRYQYRFALYLYDNSIDASLHWIILWLNQIKSEREFSQITKLLIPTADILKKLRAQYLSNAAVVTT